MPGQGVPARPGRLVHPQHHTAQGVGLKDVFYQYSLEWLRAAHVMFLLPERTADSVGVQMEIAEAERRGIPIFTDIEEMKKYARLSDSLHDHDE